MFSAYLMDTRSPCYSDADLREFRELEKKALAEEMSFHSKSPKLQVKRKTIINFAERDTQTIVTLGDDVDKTVEVKELETQIKKLVTLWRKSKSQVLKLEEECARVRSENEVLKSELRRARPELTVRAPSPVSRRGSPHSDLSSRLSSVMSTPHRVDGDRVRAHSAQLPAFKPSKDHVVDDRSRHYSIGSVDYPSGEPNQPRDIGEDCHSFFSLSTDQKDHATTSERTLKPPCYPMSYSVTPTRVGRDSSPIITNEELMAVRASSRSTSPALSVKRTTSPLPYKFTTTTPTHPHTPVVLRHGSPQLFSPAGIKYNYNYVDLGRRA